MSEYEIIKTIVAVVSALCTVSGAVYAIRAAEKRHDEVHRATLAALDHNAWSRYTDMTDAVQKAKTGTAYTPKVRQ